MSDLQQYKERHECVLHGLITATPIPAPRLKEALNYTLFPGGKRLRPLLVYACGILGAVPVESLDIIAAAIEIMHAYSLVHDDLPAMDNDDLRRGRPTCHRAFDEATAILVGDGLQTLAIEMLVHHLPKTLSMTQVVAVTQILLRAAGPSGMVSGQSMDLSLLGQASIDETTLETIHHLKTGQLMIACITMVLAAGDFAPQEADALRQFGHHLGLLYQMQDDYLDQYGSTTSLGKGRSSDLANQKQTFANLYSQSALIACIQEQITKAQQALNFFSGRCDMLEELFMSITQRCHTLPQPLSVNGQCRV
ncbi:MAG: polyprenyl synthetase family protein [Gammaproteobacteria bacterium]|nr:polyprenyl synthetase family protein [Gammaproteobacteria bacterium]